MTISSAPRLAAFSAIEHDGAVLFAYLRDQGVQFNAARKVDEAEAFSESAHGSALAFPTKLCGVTEFQDTLASFQDGAFGRVQYRALVLRAVDDTRKGRRGLRRLALHVQGCRVGYIADKHAAWLMPLLNLEKGTNVADGIVCYALQVTGGKGEKRTRGLNVCITGLAARIRSRYGILPGAPEDEADANYYGAHIDAAAMEAAQEDAYASGNASRIHAMTDAEHIAGPHA